MTIGLAAWASLLPIALGPSGLGQRGDGPLLGNTAKLPVAGLPELDDPPLATVVGDGAGTGQRLHTGGHGETNANISELYQESRAQENASPPQRVQNWVVPIPPQHAN